MIVPLMREIKQCLANSRVSTDTKRTIWCVCVTLFMGSLRGSEILSHDSLKFDPVKTLLGSDTKTLEAESSGRKVQILQLRLKQPKTARSNPVQIVELSKTAGLLCPVKAFNDWRKSRKCPLVGGKPVFTWASGKLVTMTEMKTLLGSTLLKISLLKFFIEPECPDFSWLTQITFRIL